MSGSSERRYERFTFKANESVSSAINLLNGTAAGLVFPDVALNNASLKMQVATEMAGPWFDLKNGRGVSDGDFTVTVYRNEAVPFENLALLAAWQYVRFAGATPEDADRSLFLAIRPV